jgi:hypothetical protein
MAPFGQGRNFRVESVMRSKADMGTSRKDHRQAIREWPYEAGRTVPRRPHTSHSDDQRWRAIAVGNLGQIKLRM